MSRAFQVKNVLAGATALNGKDRILNGKVDIGCCEHESYGSLLLLR